MLIVFLFIRLVVAQDYNTDVNPEYAIKGNSALLKCAIPSFVADFVSVTAWVTSENKAFYPSQDYGKEIL